VIENTMMNTDLPIREPDQIRQNCARKFMAVQVSDHFQAILECLLGERACPLEDWGGVWAIAISSKPSEIRSKSNTKR